MIKSYSAGGDVDAWCTKCKLELGHTIVAMVGNVPRRVKCNTCHGEHNYRTGHSAAGRKGAEGRAAAVRKTKSPGKRYDDYTARLNSADPSQASRYTIYGNFIKDQIVEHTQFGIGVVVSVITGAKIEVLFRSGTKLLVQNRQQE